ncbi:MAG: tryptophan synthase subunit alpha, partial [Candidatus Wildermuthbacteria bacterium]|nr:tryptophan synthase subunit alpha [Candidatus Wildermuthbacteria bacterium]
TGARKKISSQTIDFLKRARKLTSLPLVVGFGIREPRDIKILAKLSIDGVVICSKTINIINEGLPNEKKVLRGLGHYIAQMKKSTFL